MDEFTTLANEARLAAEEFGYVASDDFGADRHGTLEFRLRHDSLRQYNITAVRDPGGYAARRRRREVNRCLGRSAVRPGHGVVWTPPRSPWPLLAVPSSPTCTPG